MDKLKNYNSDWKIKETNFNQKKAVLETGKEVQSGKEALINKVVTGQTSKKV